MRRIGVFVCHCGSNIAATVDVKKVVEMALKEQGVVTLKIIPTCVPKLDSPVLLKQSKRSSFPVLLFVPVLPECTKQPSASALK